MCRRLAPLLYRGLNVSRILLGESFGGRPSWFRGLS